MSYLVLARKYRPNNFEQVVGQQSIVKTLQNAILLERVAHAYLFTGARGVGKTTVARILAKAINCDKGPTTQPCNECTHCIEITKGRSSDVYEIDGASNTGVDDVRQIKENSHYLPATSRFKIYIIDEVHMLSTNAFNALLKTLEEPPQHVMFIFATTEPHKIPVTVLSRCQRFHFKRIPASTIRNHIQNIVSQENLLIDEDGLQILARQADGSMRDALSLTDQVLAFGGKHISVNEVRDALGIAGQELIESILQSIINKHPDELFELLNSIFDEGLSTNRLIENLLATVHQIILIKTLKDPGLYSEFCAEEQTRLQIMAEGTKLYQWHQAFEVLSKTAERIGRHPFPRLVLETSLLRLLAADEIASIEEIASELSSLIDSGKARSIPVRSTNPTRKVQIPPATQNASRPAQHQVAPTAQKPAQTKTPTENVSNTKPTPITESTAQQQWETLVQHVSDQKPSLGSVLAHAQLHDLSTGCTTIGLESGSFYSEMLSSKSNMQALESICSDFFGQSTVIKVVESEADKAPPIIESRLRAEQEAQNQQVNKSLTHPMVKEALEIFGAEIQAIKPTS